jgi:hypothetical protein
VGEFVWGKDYFLGNVTWEIYGLKNSSVLNFLINLVIHPISSPLSEFPPPFCHMLPPLNITSIFLRILETFLISPHFRVSVPSFMAPITAIAT